MDRIVDIHTHILPGIDDGSKNLDESIEIIKYLKEKGITDIVLTSHYIENSNYISNETARRKLLKTLTKKLNDSNINLYLGNEVFLSNNVIELLEKKEISTINDSKYMLIELPLISYLNNLQNILCNLTDYGIIPIVAHPERYHFLQKDYKKVKELLEFNCLLQCNIDSLTGRYGKKAKKLMKWLLKNNLVQFVATDTHYVDNSNDLEKAYKKLKKIVGEEKYKEITQTNPINVLKKKKVIGNLEYLIKEGKKKK